MVQIIEENKKPSFLDQLGMGIQGLSNAAGEAVPKLLIGKQKLATQQQAAKQLQNITGMDVSQLSPEHQQEILKQHFMGKKALDVEGVRSKSKEDLFKRKQDFLGDILGRGKQRSSDMSRQGKIAEGSSIPKHDVQEITGLLSDQGIDPTTISDEDIIEASVVDPQLGNTLRAIKDTNLRENREAEKEKRKTFESERSFHSGYSKKAEEQADQLRESLPRKANALNNARNAVETGDLKYFSLDKLADATGIDFFRTAKGAQLITAGKENLLSNMARVSARAQNQWFEQRLNSMFPKIGQSKEANLTVQEMLEGEVALDQAYLSEFDKISQRDQEDYGYVKKDIVKRAHSAIKPLEKDILNRTSYRMREVEEQEMGLPGLKSQVGKNVPKGTPMTLAMAKLYKEKFGDKALDVAEKSGYYIPTLEEFKRFRSSLDEFREGLSE